MDKVIPLPHELAIERRAEARLGLDGAADHGLSSSVLTWIYDGTIWVRRMRTYDGHELAFAGLASCYGLEVNTAYWSREECVVVYSTDGSCRRDFHLVFESRLSAFQYLK